MARRILFLVFPGMQALDLVGPHQMFSGANDESPGAYEIVTAAAEAGPVACSSGLSITATRAFAALDARTLRGVDTVIAVGGDEAGMRAALRDGRVAAIARAASGRARRIASVCSGAFFLARAGLLDGKRAATHWRAASELARAYPAIAVDADSIFVRDGAVWTSAGVTAGIDMALAMIEEDCGRAVALAVARRHVVFRIRPGGQTQFSAELEAQGATDGALPRLAAAVLAAPDRDWRIDALAAQAGMSARTLSRAFAKTFNQSPAAFVERVRIDAARRLLIETHAPIDAIARSAGFGSVRRLDRAFRRALAIPPSAFRARFSTQTERQK